MRRLIVAAIATTGLLVWAAPAGADTSAATCVGGPVSAGASIFGYPQAGGSTFSSGYVDGFVDSCTSSH
jgi:hypothetical protein